MKCEIGVVTFTPEEKRKNDLKIFLAGFAGILILLIEWVLIG